MVPQRVRDGLYRLVLHRQLFPAAGAFSVGRSGILREHFDKAGPVVNQNGPGFRHAEIEVRQSGDKIRPVGAVPEYPGLMLMETLVLRQGGGVAWAQLAE